MVFDLSVLPSEIERWWKIRVESGQSLGPDYEWRKGWDYKDDGPWHERIALAALMIDYRIHSRIQDVPPTWQFAFEFRKVCPVISKHKLFGTYKTEFESSRTRRTYLHIPKIEICQDHINRVKSTYIGVER